jgi:hypothetical protein
MREKTEVSNYCSNNGYQPYTVKWLEVLCKTTKDVDHFDEHFYSGSIEKETFDIFSYRDYLFQKRDYPVEHFLSDINNNLKNALETLCLCPIKEQDLIRFKQDLSKNIFTLNDFYNLQKQKSKLNFFRLHRLVGNF